MYFSKNLNFRFVFFVLVSVVSFFQMHTFLSGRVFFRILFLASVLFQFKPFLTIIESYVVTTSEFA